MEQRKAEKKLPETEGVKTEVELENQPEAEF